MDHMVKRGRLAIIPARGGSKRLPRKNVMDFGGRPMLAWSIEAALEARLFDRVIVSTDDLEIAETARQWGADVPFLRDGLADDVTPISAVTIGALGQLRSTLNEEYQLVVQLMANCPLRKAGDILAAIAAFESSGADLQVSCVQFGWLNPWWALKRDAKGHGEWMFPGAADSRSQDLPPLYVPTGAIWIARSQALEGAGTFYGPGHRFEPIAWQSAIDIDDIEDLSLARAVLQMRHNQN